MAASLTGALKSAIAYGGVNVDSTGGNNDPNMGQPPQPKLVEQLGWDEPEIKVNKRANFDDGTSIWGDPMESMSVQVKKWTNGTKAALTNSTNTILPQPSAIVQKPVSSNVQTSNSGTSALQMTSNDENWPKQQSPTLPQQSSSQWNDPTALSDRGTPPPTSHPSANYRAQQSAPTGWNSQPQQSGQQDERFLDGVIDTSGWGLQVKFSFTMNCFFHIYIMMFFDRVHPIKLLSIRMKVELIQAVGVYKEAEEEEDLATIWVDHCQ